MLTRVAERTIPYHFPTGDPWQADIGCKQRSLLGAFLPGDGMCSGDTCPSRKQCKHGQYPAPCPNMPQLRMRNRFHALSCLVGARRNNNGKGQKRQTRQNSQAHTARKSEFPICVELASKTAIPQAQRKLLSHANLRNPVWPECITFCCFLCSLLTVFSAHCSLHFSPLAAPKG